MSKLNDPSILLICVSALHRMKIANLVAVSSAFSQLSKRSTPSFVATMTTTTTARREATKRQASQTSTSPKKAPPKKKPSKATKGMEPPSKDIDQGDKPWYYFFTKGDAEYESYMAKEWGYEKRGDAALFEKLSLEGAQSGLSWRTILHKREAYRTTFHHFEPGTVATMTDDDVERILAQPTDSPRDVVVRHRGKIQSVIHNAKCLLEMRAEKESDTETTEVFDHFLWSFVNHKPILNRASPSNHPSSSSESEAMSKALKKRGFKFVGPTTCYAMMQACGMVIDHPVDSPEWQLAYKRLQARPGGYHDRPGTSRED
jgi:DNA-3-methyladenine glycosylase I